MKNENSTLFEQMRPSRALAIMALPTVISQMILLLNTIKRKTRGPTRCLKITQLENGQKLPVEFDEDDQAIGDNATAFVWFLGQTIRSVSCCPLQVKQWNKITNDKLDHMWSTILVRKFILNYIHYKMIIIFLVLLSIIIFVSYFFAKRKSSLLSILMQEREQFSVI